MKAWLARTKQYIFSFARASTWSLSTFNKVSWKSCYCMDHVCCKVWNQSNVNALPFQLKFGLCKALLLTVCELFPVLWAADKNTKINIKWIQKSSLLHCIHVHTHTYKNLNLIQHQKCEINELNTDISTEVLTVTHIFFQSKINQSINQ